MSSVVCQGLRSCLKPRLIEPIVLMHKLSPPISFSIPLPQQNHLEEINSHDTINIDEEEDNNIDNNNNNKVNKNDELGGWSFLNSLANPTQFRKQVTDQKTEKAYVHPMVKSTLSSKSLEMCTEGLGCETGSDISENNEEFGSSSWDKERLIAMRKSRKFSKKVVVVTTSFPPPLTSISGSDGVRVKPHREGGRLVIKAVSVSSSGTNFQAERTNGRLKLCLVVKDCEMAAAMEEEETDNNVDNDCEYEDEAYDDDDDDDDDDNEEEEEDMDGNNGNVEGGVGIGEISRPSSRCKEGGGGGGRNKVMSDWGSFWVAIS